MNASKADILSRSPLFSTLPTASLAHVAAICQPRNLRKKEILFQEGEKGFAIYFLVTGSIQLAKAGGEREVVIRVLKPGEMFAEVVLFEQDRYPVSAIALKTSLVYAIAKNRFIHLLDDPRFRSDFIASLLKKMRYLADQIQYLTLHEADDRLRLFLLEQYGHKERIVPALSKKDVAAAIGTTPETFSRLLLRLRNEDLLVWEGKSIEIDPRFWK
jgi:CRP/FNR family transcriptional regulator, dissimilatory nitrate respiration regulator